MRQPLLIGECENGYVLVYEVQETETEKELIYSVVEDTGTEQDCMVRMLEKVADYFGFSYDKFGSEKINISFDKKGHKVE